MRLTECFHIKSTKPLQRWAFFQIKIWLRNTTAVKKCDDTENNTIWEAVSVIQLLYNKKVYFLCVE